MDDQGGAAQHALEQVDGVAFLCAVDLGGGPGCPHGLRRVDVPVGSGFAGDGEIFVLQELLEEVLVELRVDPGGADADVVDVAGLFVRG
ncbi:hypothetical protein ACFU7Y_05175 [Kitasatospora sp. NPDC057542]|uniref:hypothetical protein n=1 Tax=Kitasatospora sp. NPDC057542 TaxID=3346162 RepID=UPI00368E231A